MSGPLVLGRLDAAALARLNAGAPDALRRARERAFAEAAALPLPTMRDEEWRRTDPGRFPFEFVRPPDPVPRADGPLWSTPEHEFFDVVVTVSEEGIGVADRSGVLRSGAAVVERIEDRAQRAPEDIAAGYRGPAMAAAIGAPLVPDPIEALIGAFAASGIWIEVRARAALERGVLIHHRWRRPESLAAWRTLARVGPGASLGLSEWIEGGGSGGILASSRELYAAEGARVRVLALQEAADDAAVLSVDAARVERDGEIDTLVAPLGAGALRTKTVVDLAGTGAHARMGGIGLFTGGRHADQKTVQIHSAADTTSDLLYRAIVRDTARSVFQGVIVARRGAQRIDAYQRNNHLLLNDGARADSLPGLLIDADDLKCTHGSTIGHLDRDALFYLRARGLSERAARRLLLEAFGDVLLARCPQPALRERMRAALAAA